MKIIDTFHILIYTIYNQRIGGINIEIKVKQVIKDPEFEIGDQVKIKDRIPPWLRRFGDAPYGLKKGEIYTVIRVEPVEFYANRENWDDVAKREADLVISQSVRLEGILEAEYDAGWFEKAS